MTGNGSMVFSQSVKLILALRTLQVQVMKQKNYKMAYKNVN